MRGPLPDSQLGRSRGRGVSRSVGVQDTQVQDGAGSGEVSCVVVHVQSPKPGVATGRYREGQCFDVVVFPSGTDRRSLLSQEVVRRGGQRAGAPPGAGGPESSEVCRW